MALSLTPARRLVSRAVAPFYRHRLYRWYWSEIDPSVPIAFPAGFELVPGDVADLPLLEQMGADFAAARDFLAAGHRLWLLRNGDTVAFSAWTFLGSAPSDTVRTGWLALPEATLNQEDSNTHPDFRGKGIAGVASEGISAALHRESGIRRRVTFMLDDNAASRRAAVKAGWSEFAVVDVTKFGLLRKDAAWRDRNGDGRFVVTRLRVEQPSAEGERTAGDEEMFAWIRTATRKGVPGPRRGARGDVGPVQEPVSAVGATS